MRVASIGLLTHAFLLQLSAYVVRPTSAYRAIELGVHPGLVGLIAASFALLPLVVAVFVGRWTDRGHAFWSLLIGGAIMTGGGLGLSFWSDSLGWLLLWNALVGLGHLLGVLGEQTVVAQTGGGRLDSAFGTYTFAGTIGQAVAPLILALVGGNAILPDTRLLFWIFAGVCAAMVAVTFLLPRKQAVPPASVKPSFFSALRVPEPTRRTMTGAMLLSTLVLAAVDLIQVYLPALGVERHIDSATIGALLAVRAAATMVSRLGMSRLVQQLGRTRLVFTSGLVGGVSVAMLAFPLPPVALGVCLAVAGFALGVGQPLSMTIVSLAAPPGTTSTWLALRLSGNRVGQSLIPAILSGFTAVIGTSGIFAVTGLGLLVTAALARSLIDPDLGSS